MNLRKLNEKGITEFREYLALLRAQPKQAPPRHLLTSAETSDSLSSIKLEPNGFATRFEAGEWLHNMIEEAVLQEPARDKGLWAWLSLFLFDVVCPPDRNGIRKPGADARHVPDFENYKRYYRHLLAGPWRIFRAYRSAPERALVVLCQPVDRPGDIVEQLASRQELVTNSALISTATALYIDPATKLPRKGAGGKSRGAVRRLADICNQLDVTWDLYAMAPEELLDKIPSEFDRYRL